ncbi:hypothetical protein [Mesorhizobium sp. 1B3]|uniref:hypothetical protein n=1 Tax=Mesorhizobium sp. 1B3 TaxID=3243599 RepID=UPI003D994D2B
MMSVSVSTGSTSGHREGDNVSGLDEDDAILMALVQLLDRGRHRPGLFRLRRRGPWALARYRGDALQANLPLLELAAARHV